jgi:UDP-glucuronate decarboxylase
MKILVTGGAGFIGSNLCRKLLSLGHYVICVDNLYTGSEENIKELFESPNFKFIKHDIIEPLMLEEKIDQIYNLACPASPPAYQGEHAIETTMTCVMGSMWMLELAKDNNAKILQASTSEVYGEPEQHPQAETYRGNVNPIGVRACYDEGKRCAESLFADYNRIYGVDTKIVRIFNTYGPFMSPNDGRVVTNFIKQVLKGESITIYGNGQQTRSFCYVDDLIEGLILLMESNINTPVNLGNPEEITVEELAKIISAKLNPFNIISYKELPSDDPTQRKPNIEKAKTLLGWEPKVGLSEGLNKTIAYLKEVV